MSLSSGYKQTTHMHEHKWIKVILQTKQLQQLKKYDDKKKEHETILVSSIFTFLILFTFHFPFPFEIFISHSCALCAFFSLLLLFFGSVSIIMICLLCWQLNFIWMKNDTNCLTYWSEWMPFILHCTRILCDMLMFIFAHHQFIRRKKKLASIKKKYIYSTWCSK